MLTAAAKAEQVSLRNRVPASEAELLARAAAAAAEQRAHERDVDELARALKEAKLRRKAARAETKRVVRAASDYGIRGSAICAATMCASRNAMQVGLHRSRKKLFVERRQRLRMEQCDDATPSDGETGAFNS
jgi:hypothetical protein